MAGSQRSTDNKVAASFSMVVPSASSRDWCRAGGLSSSSSCHTSRGREGLFQHLATEHRHLACCPVPATEPASPSQLIPGSRSMGSFPAPHFSINRKVSSTHQSAASPGNLLGLFCSRELLNRHSSMKSFPKHLIGQNSSKFQRADVHQVLLE